MAKQLIFVVWDTKVQNYNIPFFALTPGAAIRTFSDAATDAQTLISKHPEDFHLYQIGEYDDHTGVISSHEPHALGQASDYQQKENTQ